MNCKDGGRHGVLSSHMPGVNKESHVRYPLNTSLERDPYTTLLRRLPFNRLPPS
jgi:hypothetical protein